MTDFNLRIGIGKIPCLNTTGPWYVTIYNRALTEDRAQGWFKTHPEAIAYADRLLSIYGALRKAGAAS
jgi:hypothetical protein